MPIPFTKNAPRINRNGRPKKGQCLTDILAWTLDQKAKIKDNDGDVAAMKYIFDRLDGKPKETIEMFEERGDVPDDPEERRALAEKLRNELDLARPRHGAKAAADNKPWS